MASTLFVDGTTTVVSSWLNDINNVSYTILGNGTAVPLTKAIARTNLGLAIGTDIPSPTGTGASGTWGINISGNAVTATTATNQSGGTVNATSFNGGQLAGMRNKIINGKMEIAQRGTVFAGLSSGVVMTDRWQFAGSTTAVLTGSQQLDGPAAAPEFQYSTRIAVTTADASVASTEFASIQQKIEGFNARDLVGKTFTISFWVRSSKTGIHCLGLRNDVVDRYFVSEYTINVANTWEYKTITITGGLITAGGWNWTTGIGVRVEWMFMAGSSFAGTAGSWQVGSTPATANQVNVLDAVGNIFAITGVQLEIGTVATPFEHRNYQQELALCQRYYNNLTKGQSPILTVGLTTGTFSTLTHPVTMRATPTVSTNIADANFTTSGSPAANTWGLQVIGISAASKTGTATVTITADPDKTVFYIYTATFSIATNALSPGTGIFVIANAEL